MVNEYKQIPQFRDFKYLDDCESLLEKNSGDYKEIFTKLEKIMPSEFWRILSDAIRVIPKTETLGFSHVLAYLNPILHDKD